MNPASPQAQLARSQDYFEATLRSETRRAFAIIGVVGLILALVLSEHSWKSVDGRLLFAAIGGMVLLITLQLISLLLVSRARRLARPIPVWFIVMSLVLESLLPAGIMSANIFSGVLPPYASLVSPPLLANGLMVIFTALRLRPSLCIIAGTIASAAYGSLVLYTIYGLGIPHPTTGLPSVAYLSHTVFIFA
jgi:hypothetical protein